MIVVDKAKDLIPVGRIASRFGLRGIGVDTLLATAERLGLSAALRVDRTIFFDRAQVDQLIAELSPGHE